MVWWYAVQSVGQQPVSAKLVLKILPAEKCSAKFGAWVVNGFAVVFENNGSDGEDDLRRFQKCQQKIQMLHDLSKN